MFRVFVWVVIGIMNRIMVCFNDVVDYWMKLENIIIDDINLDIVGLIWIELKLVVGMIRLMLVIIKVGFEE